MRDHTCVTCGHSKEDHHDADKYGACWFGTSGGGIRCNCGGYTEYDPFECLRGCFRIVERGPEWSIHCKYCTKAWSLQKHPSGVVHAGNILVLLNHAVGHEEAGDKK